MPEPTAAELAKEAEQEAAVFAQAVNVEKLLTMLRSLDPAKDNLADNEEIQVSPAGCLTRLTPDTPYYEGIVPIQYGFAAQDREIDRQVQSEKRQGDTDTAFTLHTDQALSADLVSMNETFVRARTIFDRMMEESLARHTGGPFVPLYPSALIRSKYTAPLP